MPDRADSVPDRADSVPDRADSVPDGEPAPAATNPMVADREGHGPAVVLLHGQPGTAWDWQWVTPHLVDGFDVIAPDRPGYGRTGGSAAGFAANATSLVGLLDRLDLPRAVVAGHSWAGGVVLSAALSHPERLVGAVLVSSVGPGERIGWDDRVLAAPVVGEAIAAITIGGVGLVLGSQRVQRLANRRLAGRAEDAVKALTQLTGDKAAGRVWRSFVVEQRALLRELDDLKAGLGSITVPVSVVYGDSDHLVPPAVGRMLASAIPTAVGVELAGAGHLLPHDRPAEIAAAIRDVHDRGTGAQAQTER